MKYEGEVRVLAYYMYVLQASWRGGASIKYVWIFSCQEFTYMYQGSNLKLSSIVLDHAPHPRLSAAAGLMETAPLTRARRSRLRLRPVGLPPGAKM
jgi:hypothetical protein